MFMVKDYFFSLVLKTTSEETGISEQDIISKKRNADIVEARHIMIHILNENWFSDNDISTKLNVTREAVCMARNNFGSRLCNRMVTVTINQIKTNISINYK